MEEEDELILISCGIITACMFEIPEENESDVKKRKLWMHPWRHSRESKGAAHVLVPDLLRFNDYFHFNNFVRMNENQFDFLLKLVSPMIQKQDTNMRKCIGPKERLIITLRYLATGKNEFFR